MADISAVFVSIDLYSSSLDKLIKKTDRAADKLLAVTNVTNTAVNKMALAGLLANQASAGMQKSASVLNTMVDKMNKAGASVEKVTNNLQTADGNTKKTTGHFEKLGKVFNKVKEKADNLNKSINKGFGKAFDSAFNLDNMQKAAKLVDDMARTNGKLGAVNDGSQTQKQLQDKVYAAAGHSRTSYADTAGAVSKLETTTGALFKSNDETIDFTELAQKAFVTGGTSKEERSSSMDKLTDSMAGGGLKGDDLNALAQTAPAIVEAISSYTGSTGNDLTALADKGQITAEVIKNSMFAASGQINDSFADAPMTFEDIWTRIQDGGLQAFSGIMEKITELIETPEFSGFINGIITGLGMLADGVSWIIDVIQNGWSTIGPILGVAVIAILAVMTANILAMAFSWILAALPILLIIGLIFVLVGALVNMGVSWQQIIGFIGGLIGGFATLFNDIFIFIWNIVADFINFFANAFHDPISSIQIAIGTLAANFLDIVENMARGIEGLINKIPGVKVDFTSGITELRNNIETKVEKLKTAADYKDYVKKKDYKDIKEGALEGYDFGIDAANKISQGASSLSDPFGEDKTNEHSFDSFDPFKNTNPGNPLPVEGTGPGGSVNVEMPDDDLDYLREIAERDYIANVATNSLAPNISVQFGDVHETADANKVAGRIREILQNEIAVASEGVY